MPSGTVKFFNDAKGFGFVTLDEGGKDVFLPAVSVTSSGLPGLKAGQRISFDVQPDSKGPKAVDLKLLAGPAPVHAQKHQPARPSDTRAERPPTLYCDPASDTCAEVLAEFRAAGMEPRVVNYLETPPTRDELKNLSALMRDSGQGRVRAITLGFDEFQGTAGDETPLAAQIATLDATDPEKRDDKSGESNGSEGEEKLKK